LANRVRERATRTRGHFARDESRCDEQEALDEKYGDEQSSYRAVPPGPFTETRTAQALNAARFLLDSAERGYDDDRVERCVEPRAARASADRRGEAHVRRVAAERDEVAARGLGFKNVPIEHTYIKGYGHWKMSSRPRCARRFARTAPGARRARRDGGAAGRRGAGRAVGAATLYGTAIGGVAAGGLLVAMAANKRLRALVKENRELNRALMLDDLSGLANKRAHRLAIESVTVIRHLVGRLRREPLQEAERCTTGTRWATRRSSTSAR
jgi:hypothetical protein